MYPESLLESVSERDTRKGIYEDFYQIVFVSPESFFTAGKRWREMLREEHYMVGFVVDEAHLTN